MKYTNNSSDMTLVIDAYQKPRVNGKEVLWEQLVIEPGCSGELKHAADTIELDYRACDLECSQFEVTCGEDYEWVIEPTQKPVDHEDWVYATHEEALSRLKEQLFG